MRLRARLARLERHSPPSDADDQGPPVEFWLPRNGPCDPPGLCPCPDGNAAQVIYQPEKPPPGGVHAWQAVARSCSDCSPTGPPSLVGIDHAGRALARAAR